MATTAPFGTWRSEITFESLTEAVVRLGDVVVDGDDIYWMEGRPSEQGRQVIVRRAADGTIEDLLPSPFSARTLVHEYGGISYAVRAGIVWFCNLADQRVWRIAPHHEPEPITPDDGARFADLDVSPDGAMVVAVRERHLDDGVVNDIVMFHAEGGSPSVVAEGHDFYAAPRWSPDGARLCWVSWDHPNMPWDATHLWDLVVERTNPSEHLSGDRTESISQPRWLPDGRLAWVSDRSGWWNLQVEGEPLAPGAAEFTGPDWLFGQATYAGLPDGSLLAAYTADGASRLARITADGTLTDLDLPFTDVASLRARPDGTVACIAASPTAEPAVVVIDLSTTPPAVDVVRSSSKTPVDPALVSVPEAVSYPSSGGRTAHALFYPPHHPDHRGPPDERPPLVVMTHGGPTGSTSSTLNRRIQLWTSRGIAVVDVNYGGSTGYGREYREQLKGSWGVVDVDDAVAAAHYLSERGDVDGLRMVIRGGSAGGYTTLAALAFRPGVFAAGTSLYGVGDLEALARDTHKFESRYLDGLVGPYPEARDLYLDRSPIHHTDQLSCPLLLLQGSEDKVVPPSQAESMAAALQVKGIPFAHVVFDGEQHGFRRAENIRRAAELELWFYGEVLGFALADEIEPGVLVGERSPR